MVGGDVFQTLACLANFRGRSATAIGLPMIFWGVRFERLCHALGKKKMLPIQTPNENPRKTRSKSCLSQWTDFPAHRYEHSYSGRVVVAAVSKMHQFDFVKPTVPPTEPL
jgi:hypothetical protein